MGDLGGNIFGFTVNREDLDAVINRCACFVLTPPLPDLARFVAAISEGGEPYHLWGMPRPHAGGDSGYAFGVVDMLGGPSFDVEAWPDLVRVYAKRPEIDAARERMIGVLDAEAPGAYRVTTD